jgi:hypothetical protein
MALSETWHARLETAGLAGLVLGLLLLAPLGITPREPNLLVYVELARLLGLGLVLVGLSLFLGLRKPWLDE